MTAVGTGIGLSAIEAWAQELAPTKSGIPVLQVFTDAETAQFRIQVRKVSFLLCSQRTTEIR